MQKSISQSLIMIIVQQRKAYHTKAQNLSYKSRYNCFLRKYDPYNAKHTFSTTLPLFLKNGQIQSKSQYLISL